MPVAADRHVGRQRRRSRGLQPCRRPRVQVLAGFGLQCGQQVRQRRRSERVLGEVAPDAREERLFPDPCEQLLQHRRALGIRDAVEVVLRCLHVGDVGGDGVRGRQLVLLVRPFLPVHGERGPLPRVLRRRGLHVGALVVRERLLQPHVVPPSRRHQVAEPHVAHLVQDDVRAVLPLREGRAVARDHRLVERHAPRVLHGAEVVLGDEHLVVRAPRERETVMGVVEVHSLSRDLLDVLTVDRRCQCLPTEDPQRDGGTGPVLASAFGAAIIRRTRLGRTERGSCVLVNKIN